MDMQTSDFVCTGSLADLKARGRVVVHGRHSPILVVYDAGRVFALDNRCPHLDRRPLEEIDKKSHKEHIAAVVALHADIDAYKDGEDLEAGRQRQYLEDVHAMVRLCREVPGARIAPSWMSEQQANALLRDGFGHLRSMHGA